MQASAATRPSWFPGSQFPEHLKGELPGDFGFDPLGLAKDEASKKWCVCSPLLLFDEHHVVCLFDALYDP